MKELDTPHSIAFIGTGTEVGKSYAACALARALVAENHEVLALKPVESGISQLPHHVNGTSENESEKSSAKRDFPRLHDGTESDAERLASAATFGVRSLYELPEPISPHLAAQHCGVKIDLHKICDWFTLLRKQHPAAHSILETAGGALSPLSAEADNLNLIQLLQPEKLILVAPNRLGVLHDVAAALCAVNSRGLSIAHIFLSEVTQQNAVDPSTSSNLTELKKVVIPRFALQKTRVDSVGYGANLGSLLPRIFEA